MSAPILNLFNAAPSAAGDGPPAFVTFAPLVLIVLVMYFLLLRPQMQQQKAHKAKLSALKKGDQVLTGGGFLAKVVSIDGDQCTLEIAAGVKVRALTATITDVVPPGGAAND